MNIELANFILKNNTLTFDFEFYNQVKGKAMGTIFLLTYVSLLLGYLEIKVYYLSELRFSQEIDNCRILQKVNLIKPDCLLLTLNQINNSI